jgi:hypothetical protein
MSAKAKASEVGPAVGTWSKLQQAFLVETNNFGSDTKISYVKPGGTQAMDDGTGTGNFWYETGVGSGAIVGNPPEDICPDAKACSGTATWIASNPAPLGDCPPSSAWNATLTTNFAPTAIAGTDPNCKVLTPQFSNLR